MTDKKRTKNIIKGKKLAPVKRANILPLKTVMSGGIVVAVCFFAHNLGKMEGKIESLQKTIKMQAKITANAKLLQISPNNQTIKRTEISDKNEAIVAKPKKKIKKNETKTKRRVKRDRVISKASNRKKQNIVINNVLNNKDIQNKSKHIAFAAKLPDALCGKVMIVQQAQKKVMINFGKDTGIELGERFVLWRNGVYIGELEATNIFADMTACRIVTDTESGIYIGDKVRRIEIEVANANRNAATYHISNKIDK